MAPMKKSAKASKASGKVKKGGAKASKASKKGGKKAGKAKKVSKKGGKKKAAKPMKKAKTAKKVSKVGAKWRVFAGLKEKTKGGCVKSDLKKNKAGRVVSKKKSDLAKKRPSYQKIMAWNRAAMQARKALGVVGFQAIGGKTAQGQALLKKARSIYKKA